MRNSFLTVLVLFVLCLLAGCAKKIAPAEFRPLQLHWFASPGQEEADLSGKDVCVIRLTSSLMAEPLVQASAIEELEYRVVYGKSSESSEILYFEGVCEDSALEGLPECRWNATCDSQAKTVVKFNNGD